jgi:hypothetical protein
MKMIVMVARDVAPSYAFAMMAKKLEGKFFYQTFLGDGKPITSVILKTIAGRE